MWKPYLGQPFEGERIFKFKCGDVQKRFFYTFPEDDVVRNNLNWDQVFYLDESPSYSIEEERNIFNAGYTKGYEDNYHGNAWHPELSFDEWIKEREGK
jgi:hypothetical protein